MDRWPDIPSLVSVDFLKRLDKDPPGTWISQPKIDGRRRIAWNEADCWRWKAKNKDDAQPIHKSLRELFESFPWPEGIGLDIELSGPRHAGQPHALHVFDLLMIDGYFLGQMPFEKRYDRLLDIWQGFEADGYWTGDPADGLLRTPRDGGVHMVYCNRSGSLVDHYMQQLQDPLSEGLVIRRADSVMIGGRGRCMKHPHMFKTKYRNVKELEGT